MTVAIFFFVMLALAVFSVIAVLAVFVVMAAMLAVPVMMRAVLVALCVFFRGFRFFLFGIEGFIERDYVLVVLKDESDGAPYELRGEFPYAQGVKSFGPVQRLGDRRLFEYGFVVP